MIIFGLDGVLADNSHRLHLIDPRKRSPNGLFMNENKNMSGVFFKRNPDTLEITNEFFKPDYEAYYSACGDDEPIIPTCSILYKLWVNHGEEIEIWTDRPVSFNHLTIKWVNKNIFPWNQGDIPKIKVPIKCDNRPVWQIKEQWLDEYMKWPELNQTDKEYKRNDLPEMVFESDPESIEMYRKRGIFVFDCRQEK